MNMILILFCSATLCCVKVTKVSGASVMGYLAAILEHRLHHNCFYVYKFELRGCWLATNKRVNILSYELHCIVESSHSESLMSYSGPSLRMRLQVRR
jgi:hypothetical protein